MKVTEVKDIINIFIKEATNTDAYVTLKDLKRVFKTTRDARRFLGLKARAEGMKDENRKKDQRNVQCCL